MNEDPNVLYILNQLNNTSQTLSSVFIFSIMSFLSYNRDDSCFGSGISIVILSLLSITYR